MDRKITFLRKLAGGLSFHYHLYRLMDAEGFVYYPVFIRLFILGFHMFNPASYSGAKPFIKEDGKLCMEEGISDGVWDLIYV